MADIAQHDPEASPSAQDDLSGTAGLESRPNKRRAPGDDDDDDDEKPGRERRKIDIKFIQDKSRRHITFSKRKAGIMKKAYELSVLTGTQVLLLVVSETGLVYTFTTPKLQPLVTKSEGKNLIQACLNAPSPPGGDSNGLDQDAPVDSPDDANHAQVPPQQPGKAQYPGVPQAYGVGGMTADHLAYQSYLQQQQAAAQGGQYPLAQPGRMPQHPGGPHHQ